MSSDLACRQLVCGYGVFKSCEVSSVVQVTCSVKEQGIHQVISSPSSDRMPDPSLPDLNTRFRLEKSARP